MGDWGLGRSSLPTVSADCLPAEALAKASPSPPFALFSPLNLCHLCHFCHFCNPFYLSLLQIPIFEFILVLSPSEKPQNEPTKRIFSQALTSMPGWDEVGAFGFKECGDRKFRPAGDPIASAKKQSFLIYGTVPHIKKTREEIK